MIRRIVRLLYEYKVNRNSLAYTVFLNMSGIQIRISLLTFFSESLLYNAFMLLYIDYVSYYIAYRSLYRNVVCSAPVSRKANGERNQLGAWRYSDTKADLYK